MQVEVGALMSLIPHPPEALHVSNGQHRAVLEAVSRREPDAARQLMEAHVRGTGDFLVGLRLGKVGEMGDKPVVGVSVGYHDFGDYQGVGFQRPIALAGGVPLILSRVEGTLDDVLDVLDAVVIGGGRDIEPHRYGQEPHELLGIPTPTATSSSWSSCTWRSSGASRCSACAAGSRSSTSRSTARSCRTSRCGRSGSSTRPTEAGIAGRRSSTRPSTATTRCHTTLATT